MRTLLLLTFLLSSCANRYHLSQQYVDVVGAHKSKSTAVVFLVDGLTYSIAQNQIRKNNLPYIKNYFLANQSVIQKAHSVFPTLTFPNISSLLHQQPVDVTEAIGNKLIFKNKLIDFESVSDRAAFTELMHGNNIFERLHQKNSVSVSIDYGLGADATISTGIDLQSGYAASQIDYDYLDQKKLDTLKLLLTNLKSDQWPEFIFIHLIGVDFLSHLYGPNSTEALSYLQRMDTKLNVIFELLKAAEKNHPVTALLTSDHGFDLQPTSYVNIESVIAKLESSIRVINEGRFVAGYYFKKFEPWQLQRDSQKILKNSSIQFVVSKVDSNLKIMTKKELTLVPLSTLELSTEIKNKFPPYFVQNAISYFRAQKHPDLLIIPNSTHVFQVGKGFHGGPTEDETITPLMIRNLKTNAMPDTPAIWQLLEFVK